MKIIHYIDCRGIGWWTSAYCEHCGQPTPNVVDSYNRPWFCVKANHTPGCGKDIQSFDTLDKAEAYYNLLPPALTGHHPVAIVADDPVPTPLPSPPSKPAPAPIDWFAINKEFSQ